MNIPFINKLKAQISSLYGFEFEGFINELFLLIYGANGFIPIRERKDKGCDGIVKNENKVLSCYAPYEYDKKDFEKKANDDFKDYEDNWKANYKNWMMLVNHKLSPDQITKITSLKKDATILGLDQIVALIDEKLTRYQIRKIANFLKISDKEFLSMDYLSEILEDLLKSTEDNNINITYSKPVYILKKIKINYEAQDLSGASEEYELLCEEFPFIDSLLKAYEDNEISRIKFKIINDFNKMKGNFKERLDSLHELYLTKYSHENDDDYNFYIKAVLVYIFEQCLIGKKTEEENDITSSRN